MISCHTAPGLGTLFGGWRIVRTMGSRVTHPTPVQGFCAETGGAVSTTHTITGCVMGVGAARRLSAVRWGVARGIVVARVITPPATAAVGAAPYWVASSLVR